MALWTTLRFAVRLCFVCTFLCSRCKRASNGLRPHLPQSFMKKRKVNIT